MKKEFKNAELAALHNTYSLAKNRYGQDDPRLLLHQKKLGIALLENGEYSLAKDVLGEALSLATVNLNKSDSELFEIEASLAKATYKTGDYSSGQDRFEKALSSSIAHLGEIHSCTSSILKDLSELFTERGDYNQAIPYIEKAISIDESLKGLDHPDIINSKIKLADNLYYLGSYEKAKIILEEALVNLQSHYGKSHPTYTVILNNLANILKELGDYEGSRNLLETALNKTISLYGDSHPSVAISQSNLANVLSDLGDYFGAKVLLEKALSIDISHYGDSHPTVTVRQNNLALVLQDLGDYAGAKDLLEKALSIDISHYGDSHPTVAVRQSNLALVLKDLGDYTGAKGLLEKALESDIRNLGASHPIVAVRQSNLALVLQALGDYEGAKILLEKALGSDVKHYRTFHPRIAVGQSNLSLVLQALGDYIGAKGLLEKVLDSDVQHYGASHPTVATRYNNLARVYFKMGDMQKALGYFKQAYSIFIKLLGAEHPHTKQVFGDIQRTQSLIKHICIFIVSSSELESERNEVHRVFDELNNIVPHLDLKPVKWETDTAGGLSLTGRIQNEINEKLFDSHIVIGLFHTKVSPYIKEEMDIAFKRRIKTFAYFKTDGNTYPDVEEYKQHIANQQVLYKDYETLADLKNHWWHNLLLYLVETYPYDSRIKYLNTSVNYDIKHLVGRREALQDIRRSLDKPNALLMLNGMRGVGKTTLAKAFIETYLPNYRYIIYTAVQDGFINALRIDFSLHKAIGIIIDKEDTDEKVFTMVIRNIQNIEGPNLWVIDNAKEDLSNYYNRLPSQPNWQVLITSRESIDGVPQLYLDVLTEEEALELFLKHYGAAIKPDQKVSINEITESVGYHTLTVELLGKLAKKKYGGRLRMLQEALAANGISLDSKIKLRANDANIKDKNTALINIVVQLFALDQLDSDSILLLRYWCLLPAVDIPQDDLAELIPWHDQDDLINVRDALLKKGWLQSTEPGQYRCHQIIQEAVLQQYPIDSWGEKLEEYLWHIKTVIGKVQNEDNPVNIFKWTIYVQSLVNKLKLIKSKALISLSDQLAGIYKNMGRYKESAALWKACIKDADVVYEDKDPTHAALQNNLALVLQDLGDYAGAKDLLEKALDSDIKHYGASYPEVAAKVINLGYVYLQMGEREKASELLAQALHILMGYFDKEHPKVQATMKMLFKVDQELKAEGKGSIFDGDSNQ